MDSRTILYNKLMHLEDSMVIYGIYNAETLEKLINTVHHMHNFMSLSKKLFAGQLGTVMIQPIYANRQDIQHHSIISLLYLRTINKNMF